MLWLFFSVEVPLAHHLSLGKSLPTTRHILVHVMVVFLAMRLPQAHHQGKSLPSTRHMFVHVMVVSLVMRLPQAHRLQGKSLSTT